MADYRARPFTPEEKRKFPDAGKSKANITRIYGTTLIAALWLSPWLVLIQQGDGRCDVFYEDGHAEQPIPWDERCQDNVTTSMCDLDAASSIRSCLINFAQEKPIACFLESDGVEDAYRDTYDNLGGSHTRMGGVNTFNKMLIGQILKRYVNPEEQAFEETLTGLLSDFSASGQFGRGGSGDDVSVAGIVNHDGIKSYEALYLNDIARYERDESIFWLESALRSKKRKLGILEQRRTQALHDLNGAGQANTALRNALQQKYDEANREYLAFQEDYNAIKRRLDNLKK